MDFDGAVGGYISTSPHSSSSTLPITSSNAGSVHTACHRLASSRASRGLVGWVVADMGAGAVDWVSAEVA